MSNEAMMAVATAFLGAFPAIGGGVAFATEVFMTALFMAYFTMLSAVVYVRLRELNDGMTVTDMAATVD